MICICSSTSRCFPLILAHVNEGGYYTFTSVTQGSYCMHMILSLLTHSHVPLFLMTMTVKQNMEQSVVKKKKKTIIANVLEKF